MLKWKSLISANTLFRTLITIRINYTYLHQSSEHNYLQSTVYEWNITTARGWRWRPLAGVARSYSVRNQYGVVLCCPGSLLCTDCTDFSLNSRLYSELTLLYKSEYLYVLLILMQYTNIQNNSSIVTLRAVLEVICALSCIRWPQKTCQISSGHDRTSKQICPRKTSYEILSRFRNTQICYLQIDKLIYPNFVFYKY